MLRLYDSVQQFISKSGVPLSSGKVWVYMNGTDDLASVYADPNGLVPLSNPLPVDDDGRTLGAFVDADGVYRIEVRGPSGNLEWSVYPVSPLGGSGSGGTGVIPVIVSSDGSVRVDETIDGNRIIFDLSAHVEESVDSLAWYRGDGCTVSGDIYVPGKTAGTLEQGDAGVWLPGEQYFHVTYHVRAQKTSAQPYYDKVDLLIQLMDGDTFAVTNVCRRGVVVDWSMGLSQDFEFSCDVKTEGAAELQLRILSQDVQGGNFTLLDTEIHRVYSGAPYIPVGAGGGDYEGENGILVNNTARTIAADTSVLQPKLTAGENISIVGNTISATAAPQVNADWDAESGVARILNKPDLSLYVTDSELETILSGYATTQAMNTELAGKQDVISDLDTIRAGAQAGSTAVQPATLGNYQEKLTAGSNVQISAQNVISATDTTYTAGNGLDLTGTEFSVDTNTVALKSDLPGEAQLVPEYTLPTDAGKVLMAGSTTYWASLSDYVTDTELSTILEGYQTALTAGSNIQISNGTISATDTTYTAGSGLDLNGTTFSVDTSTVQSKLTAGSNVQISAQNVISATDTTYTAGTALDLTGTEFSVKVDGSTVTVNASGELQAAPAITVDQTYDPTSTNPQSGTAVAEAVAGVDTSLFEAVYGTTTFSEIMTAIQNKKVVYCRVNNSQMAFLAYDHATGITPESGRWIEFQYYRSNSDSTGPDSVFVYTVSYDSTWSTIERYVQKPADWNAVAGTPRSIANKPDLSVYATTSAMDTALATKQDTLTAGTNITISAQNEISAVDTTYTAGSGLDLTGTEFSVDTTTIATKAELADYVTDTELSTILQGYQEALTAGSNITISNGTISATDTTYTAGSGLDLTGTEFSVDTTTIATKSDLADYTPTASLGAVALSNDYDDLDNKPTIPTLPDTKNLVAGSNVTIVEGQDSVTINAADTTYSAGTGISITNNVIACTATFTQQQANWNESDSSSVQYIMNKPTIPTLPATKNLVAGNNLTITEGQDSVTLDVTGIPTIGTVEV